MCSVWVSGSGRIQGSPEGQPPVFWSSPISAHIKNTAKTRARYRQRTCRQKPWQLSMPWPGAHPATSLFSLAMALLRRMVPLEDEPKTERREVSLFGGLAQGGRNRQTTTCFEGVPIFDTYPFRCLSPFSGGLKFGGQQHESFPIFPCLRSSSPIFFLRSTLLYILSLFFPPPQFFSVLFSCLSLCLLPFSFQCCFYFFSSRLGLFILHPFSYPVVASRVIGAPLEQKRAPSERRKQATTL